MGNYRLGLYEKAMPAELSWIERLAAAKNAGFDFLEISIDETDWRLARLVNNSSEINEIRRATYETGLHVRTMCLSGHRKYPLGSRDPEIRRRSVEILHGAVRFADALGIRLIQLAGYDVYYEKHGEDTRKMFTENLSHCVDYAAQYGVPLGFETMEIPFMNTVGKAMQYVNVVDSPYLGIYPDLGNLTNVAAAERHDIYADIRLGRGHVFAMHLKETRQQVFRDLDFGEGHVDFERGVAQARSLGVSMFVAELWHNLQPDWIFRLKEVSEYLRSMLDER